MLTKAGFRETETERERMRVGKTEHRRRRVGWGGGGVIWQWSTRFRLLCFPLDCPESSLLAPAPVPGSTSIRLCAAQVFMSTVPAIRCQSHHPLTPTHPLPNNAFTHWAGSYQGVPIGTHGTALIRFSSCGCGRVGRRSPPPYFGGILGEEEQEKFVDCG